MFAHQTEETVSNLDGIVALAGSDVCVQYGSGVGITKRLFRSSSIRRTGASSTRATITRTPRSSVTFQIGATELRYRSAATGDWGQDATTIDVFVGCASTADLSTALTVKK